MGATDKSNDILLLQLRLPRGRDAPVATAALLRRYSLTLSAGKTAPGKADRRVQGASWRHRTLLCVALMKAVDPKLARSGEETLQSTSQGIECDQSRVVPAL